MSGWTAFLVGIALATIALLAPYVLALHSAAERIGSL